VFAVAVEVVDGLLPEEDALHLVTVEVVELEHHRRHRVLAGLPQLVGCIAVRQVSQDARLALDLAVRLRYGGSGQVAAWISVDHAIQAMSQRRVRLQQVFKGLVLDLDVLALGVADPPALVGRALVAVGLAGLGEQDERRGICGLLGVPKKRAKRSAGWPKRSAPNGCAGDRSLSGLPKVVAWGARPAQSPSPPTPLSV